MKASVRRTVICVQIAGLCLKATAMAMPAKLNIWCHEGAARGVRMDTLRPFYRLGRGLATLLQDTVVRLHEAFYSGLGICQTYRESRNSSGRVPPRQIDTLRAMRWHSREALTFAERHYCVHMDVAYSGYAMPDFEPNEAQD